MATSTSRPDGVRPPIGSVGTAGAVAMGRAVGVGDVRDEPARTLLDGPSRSVVDATRRLRRTPVIGRLVRTVSDATFGHGALRMVAVDDAVTTAVNAGLRQIVVVGAGLDTRPWRLASLAGTTVFEVDRPVVQDVKRRRAEALGAPACTHQWVSVDLEAEPLAPALDAAGHDSETPTLWLWEAVLMYLPLEAGRTTLQAMAGRSAPGSQLVFTWAHRDLGAPPRAAPLLTPAVQALFRTVGEPLRCLLDTTQMQALLAETGWEAARTSGWRDWVEVLGAPVHARDLMAAERLTVAQRRSG